MIQQKQNENPNTNILAKSVRTGGFIQEDRQREQKTEKTNEVPRLGLQRFKEESGHEFYSDMQLQEIQEENMPIQVRPKTINRYQRKMIPAKETTMIA